MYLLYLGGALGGAIVSLYQNGGCNEDDIELKDTIEIDFTYDYTEDIKADVAYVASLWLYVIWDTELNNLWSRFSSLANQDIFFTGLVVFLGECGADQPLTEPAVTPLIMDLLSRM